MNVRIDPLARLILEMSKLPGIGEKTATRLAHFIINQDVTYSSNLAQALLDAKAKTGFCKSCFQFSEQELCGICEDGRRANGIICVVERPSDIAPIERSGSFNGRYHVLQGLLSPMDGIGPENLKVKELLKRLRSETDPVNEIFFALNPSLESEATALFLSRLIRPSGIKVTQVAYGLPMGGAIEFSDRQTLGKAIENRIEVN